MTDALRKAAQQALEALKADPDAMVEVEKDQWEYTRVVALRILKAALAQPEQEENIWAFGVKYVRADLAQPRSDVQPEPASTFNGNSQRQPEQKRRVLGDEK